RTGRGVVSRLFPVALARGKHLFPFRTEQLSPSAPMVLGPRGPGRVGRRRFFFSGPPAGGPFVRPLTNRFTGAPARSEVSEGAWSRGHRRSAEPARARGEPRTPALR